MSWYLLVALAVLTASAGVLVQRSAVKDTKLNPLGFLVVTGVVAAVLLAAAGTIHGLDTRWELLSPLNLALAAMLWALSNACMFYALKFTEASEFGVIFTTRALWAIAASVVFLDDSLRPLALVGAVLLFVSSVIAVWEEKVSIWNRQVGLSLATALFFGFATVNDGIILSKGFDVMTYFIYGFAAQAVLIAILSRQARQASWQVVKNRTAFIKVTILAALYAVSAVATFAAFQINDNYALITSLNQSQTVIVILGAMIFLKETKYFGRRMVAALISFAGVVMVILS